tara:strand:- start:1069 stop:1392 length:324 start_codon:yes stop_codon:yes gene_type:complete
MQKFGRLLNRYSTDEPEVLDAINTLFDKNIVEYDEESNTLTVNVDIKLKFKGRLAVDCDDHIVMNSGQKIDPDRDDGVPFSIWFNSDLDENNQPIVELSPVQEKCDH